MNNIKICYNSLKKWLCMTDFSNYNEFLKGSIFRPSQKKEKNIDNIDKPKKKIKENKWINRSTKGKNNSLQTHFTFKPTIDVGDIVELLYIDTNEKVKVEVFDNYLKQEVRFNDNPKSNRGTKAYILVPDQITKENSISILSEVYSLIKCKKIGDIIEYKGEKIKITSIKKR